jgi:RimJ/RimL family protein N-acetyltransferase
LAENAFSNLVANVRVTELETPRLLLRPYRAEDRDAFVSLHTDPEVRRHMNGPLTPQKAESRFDEIWTGTATQRTCWAIIEKETGVFAGHAFLWLDDRHPFQELGFLFFKSYWGRGFATETARRLTEHCLGEGGLPGLSATVDCDHAPSIRVLEKVGFEKASVATDEFGPYFIYSIHRPNSD